MNVLDQVVYVIREEKSAMKEETSHVRIPTSYSIGVTVTLFSLGTNEDTFYLQNFVMPLRCS